MVLLLPRKKEKSSVVMIRSALSKLMRASVTPLDSSFSRASSKFPNVFFEKTTLLVMDEFSISMTS